jgi:hypothetical protein
MTLRLPEQPAVDPAFIRSDRIGRIEATAFTNYCKSLQLSGGAGFNQKEIKKGIALDGVFDKLRARFQTEGGTV